MFTSIIHDPSATNKHTPAISVNGSTVSIRCGEKELHPTTAEHYIGEIKLYGLKDKLLFELGSAHFYPGQCLPVAQFEVFQIERFSKLVATSYCNLHGIYHNEIELK